MPSLAFIVQRLTCGTSYVVSDDTDVFLLLLHYYLEDGLTFLVTMESPIKDRVVVDNNKTVEKHRNIIPEILVVAM